VVGELLEELVTSGVGALLVVVGDRGVLPLLAHVALPVVGVHVNEVDDTVQVLLGPPRELQARAGWR
jgi:hypothetical protein